MSSFEIQDGTHSTVQHWALFWTN